MLKAVNATTTMSVVKYKAKNTQLAVIMQSYIHTSIYLYKVTAFVSNHQNPNADIYL
jgi:hypothetical protein